MVPPAGAYGDMEYDDCMHSVIADLIKQRRSRGRGSRTWFPLGLQSVVRIMMILLIQYIHIYEMYRLTTKYVTFQNDISSNTYLLYVL